MSLCKYATNKLFILIFIITSCNADCKASVNDFQNILVLTKENETLYSNDGKGNIVTKNGDFIAVACPGSYIEGTDYNYARLKCTKNVYTLRNKRYRSVKDLTCEEDIVPHEKRIATCAGNYDLISVGFQVQDNPFLEYIRVCWNNEEKAPMYSYAILKKYLGETQVHSDRPSFRPGEFFNTPQYYTNNSQKKTLKKMFKRIPPKIRTNNMLQRGHLVAKADLIYDVLQKATFQYINVAPQWGSFNMGNWKYLEMKVRRLVKTGHTDLETYTGTYGVLQIGNYNTKQDYYLDYDDQRIPVPEYFWKVIIKKEESSTLGIAIIGSNDIFEALSEPCEDIIDEVKWLRLQKPKSVRSGYMIACDLNEFKNIPGLKEQLPDFPTVTGILLTK